MNFSSKLRQRRCCVFQISVCQLQPIAEHAFERSTISAGLSEGYRNSALAVFQIAVRAPRALVAVLDVDSVNRIIERTPNAARYFVGCMLWQSGELEQEIEDNLWEVRPVNVRLVFRAHTQGLWNALRKPMASADRFGHSQVG